MDHNIVFSDKRRTLVIKIVFGEVFVYAPASYDSVRGRRIIERFMTEKAGWIERKIKAYSQNIDNLPGLLEYRKFYWHGREIVPTISPAAAKVVFDGEILTLPGPISESCDLPLKQLKKALKARAAQELTERSAYFAHCYGLDFERCGVFDAKSKWGVCTSAKKISLNWRLALIEPRLSDYVILHELCHLKHLDHSRAFWQSLTLMQPDCRERRRELKNYDFLMRYLRG